MWQKERLLSLALKLLAEACTKVFWIDCDGEEVRGNPHLVIGQNAVFAGRPVRAPQTAREMASTAAENINKCRYQMLKMPAAMAISQPRLVDDLEGMGLSTTGFDAGSESPTDPTALVARQ